MRPPSLLSTRPFPTQLRCAELDKVYDINLGRAGRTYNDSGADRPDLSPTGLLCSADRKIASSPINGTSSWGTGGILIRANNVSGKIHCGRFSTIAAKNNCRYGFLITDGELVVLRVMGHAHGSGLRGDPATAPAAGRSSLPAYISTSTSISQLSASIRDVLDGL